MGQKVSKTATQAVKLGMSVTAESQSAVQNATEAVVAARLQQQHSSPPPSADQTAQQLNSSQNASESAEKGPKVPELQDMMGPDVKLVSGMNQISGAISSRSMFDVAPNASIRPSQFSSKILRRDLGAPSPISSTSPESEYTPSAAAKAVSAAAAARRSGYILPSNSETAPSNLFTITQLQELFIWRRSAEGSLQQQSFVASSSADVASSEEAVIVTPPEGDESIHKLAAEKYPEIDAQKLKALLHWTNDFVTISDADGHRSGFWTNPNLKQNVARGKPIIEANNQMGIPE